MVSECQMHATHTRLGLGLPRPTRSTLRSYVELKTKDFSERVRQVQAGEEIDADTRKFIAEQCDICPGCKAIVFRDAGCKSITCPCEARFTHGEHRLSI